MSYVERIIIGGLSTIIETRIGMKISLLFILMATVFNSCFLFPKYRRSYFTYNDSSQTYSIPVIIPKGYKRERTEVDSSGNTILTYSYGSEQFYIAHMADTASDVYLIDEAANIPRLYEPTGSLVFKGMDSLQRYWREVRQDKWRAGYRNVSPEKEVRFDSATNYFMVHPVNPREQGSAKR